MLSLRNLALCLSRSFKNYLPPPVNLLPTLQCMDRLCMPSANSGFHSLASRLVIPDGIVKQDLLAPTSIQLIPSCGFKIKRKLKRRCKACYMVVRDGRAYIMCPKHGRHKQMAMTSHPKKTWILTHATQGKVRPW